MLLEGVRLGGSAAVEVWDSGTDRVKAASGRGAEREESGQEAQASESSVSSEVSR